MCPHCQTPKSNLSGICPNCGRFPNIHSSPVLDKIRQQYWEGLEREETELSDQHIMSDLGLDDPEH